MCINNLNLSKLYLGDKMKISNALCWFGLGIGGTLLYQSVKNGNLKRWTKQMNEAKMEMLEDLEDMM